MAKLSSDGTYVTVVKGDTLSQIAKDYLGAANIYKYLAQINGIKNAKNKSYKPIGQYVNPTIPL